MTNITMPREALKLALELKNSASAYWTEKEILIIEKLIDSLAQPEQEPVAEYIGENWDGSIVQLYEDLQKGTKLYTTPPKRTWVGLSEQEVSAIDKKYHKPMGPKEFAKEIEAKLKEKNT